MLKPMRVRLVAMFLVIAAVAVLSWIRLDRTSANTSKAAGSNAVMLAPDVSATMTSSLPSANCPPGPGTHDITCNGLVNPGDTIRYAVTITNNGDTAATGVDFSDTIDPTGSLVGGSIQITPVAVTDTYPVTGNVRISSANSASLNVLTNDYSPSTANNSNLTATIEAKKSTACTAAGASCPNNVTIAANGTFTYNPPAGFEGSGATADTFTYTITDTTNNLTGTGTVKLDVSGIIWFVDAAAAANGDGRLGTPFNCFVGVSVPVTGPTCFDDTTLDEANDNILLYANGAPYTGGQTLLNGQKLIGQGASTTLAGIAGITLAAGSDALPALINDPSTVTITTTLPGTNAISLANAGSATIRGLTVGNTTMFKIASGATFGTLTSSEVVLNGSGGTLNLTTGALSGSFNSTSSSSAAGSANLTLSGVTGTFNFGPTTITGAAAQGINILGSSVAATFGTTQISGTTTHGIFIGTSTGNITFGSTTVTGGTDAISLQNNSSGTRTFGTITTSGNSGAGINHGAGGGAVTVTGATSITNPTGIGINIDGSVSAVSFAATTVTKNSTGGNGVVVSNNSGNTTFNSLAVTASNGYGLFGQGNTGQINVTTNAGSISATNFAAIDITKAGAPATPIAVNFDAVSSTSSGGTGIRLDRVSGSLTNTNTSVQFPTSSGIEVLNASGATVNFGGTNVNKSSAAGSGIGLALNSGATFTFTTLSVTAGNGTAVLANDSGTVNVTTAAGSTVNATNGPALTLTLVTLSMNLTSISSLNSTGRGANLSGSGGTLNIGSTALTNSNSGGMQVDTTAAGSTMNFGNTTVNQSGSTGIVLSGNAGAVTFGALNIAPDSTFRGLHATTNTGAITTTSGAIATTSNTAVEVTGTSAAILTPLNMQLTSVNASGGSATGIILRNTSSTGAPGGFRILGSASTAGSGGTITTIGGGDLGSIPAAATTGTGIYLDNVSNVSLSNMFFGTALATMNNFGIRGDNVNDFTLRDSEFRGTFGTNEGQDEGAVRFGSENLTTGLKGTALFEGNNIAGGFENNLSVFVYGTDSLTMTVQDSANDQAVFGLNSNSLGDDSLHVESGGTGSTLNMTVNAVAFNGARGDQLQTIAIGVTNQTLTITNNQFLNGHGNIVSGGGGIDLLGGSTSASSNATINLNFSNNTIKGALGNALDAIYTGFAATINGVVFDNQIGTSGGGLNLDASRGSLGGAGIDLGHAKESGGGSINFAVRIESNDIYDINNGTGAIRLVANSAGGGTSRLEATVKDNINGDVGGSDLYSGFYAIVGGQGATDPSVMGLALTNNTFRAGAANGDNAINLDQIFTNSTAHYNIPGYPLTATSVRGELRSGGTAGANLSTFWANAASGGTGSNTLVNGGFPTYPGKVFAQNVFGITNAAFTLAVPAADPADVAIVNSTDISLESALEFGGGASANIQMAVPLGGAATATIEPVASDSLGENASVVAEAIASPARDASVYDLVAGVAAKFMGQLSPTAHAQEPEGAGGTVSATIGDLAPGSSVTIYYDVQLDPVGTMSPTVFSVSNDATITADGGITVTTDGDGNSGNGQQAHVTTVIQPETIQKSFNPTAIFTTGTSTLTFAISNNNPAGPGANASAITFTDTLPANMTIANSTVTNNCGGTLTDQTGGNGMIDVGDTEVKLTGGALNAGLPPCTITVKVKTTESGTYPNTTGAISSLEGAVGLISNTATLTVNVLTSSGVSLSGRVLTADGRGVTNAKVTITGQDGVARTTVTGRGGAFNFDDVPTGSTYTVAVVSQRFTFEPKVVAVTDQVRDVDFTGQPR